LIAEDSGLNFTVEDVENLYMYAWEQGLKGVTIYRDKCARSGILTNIKPEEEKEFTVDDLPRGYIEEVPEGLTYRKYKLRSGCGNLYFFVGVDEFENRIYDCFTNTDGVGGCTVNTQANSRLLSAGLRGGVPVEYLIEQLNKAGVCSSYQSLRASQTGMTKVKKLVTQYIPKELDEKINEMIGTPVSGGKSCASAISNVLKNILKEFNEQENEDIPYNIATKEEVQKYKNKCPECGNELHFESGCVVCPECGYSKCS
jgi:ribonucleoside-diphosphate reductase alpha chain